MNVNLNLFLEGIKSLTISSLDKNGVPFSSYAPYVKYEHKYYVYLSSMAKHSKNLTLNKKCSIFFTEDESNCQNIFARKRAVLQCDVQNIESKSSYENELFVEFEKRFGKDMIDMLKNLGDFGFFEFTPFYGEAVFGFGKAYNLGGENFDEFIQREGTSGHGSK